MYKQGSSVTACGAAVGVPASFLIRLPLFSSDCGAVAFPCNASSNVNPDLLSDAEHCAYFYARVMARRAHRQPQIVYVSKMK